MPQVSAKPSRVKAGGSTTIRYADFDGVGDVEVRVTRPSGTFDTYTGPGGSGEVTAQAPDAGQYYVAASQATSDPNRRIAAPTDFVAK